MKLRPALLAAVVGALALSGCGTTDAPVTEPEPAGSAGGAGTPVSVTDSRGQEISLDAPATEVVTLEWSSTEYVTSLGVQPVGAADVAGYSSWASAYPLDEGVTDVGLRTEPSIETIADLEPDLILADPSSIPEEAMEQMERIAPVAVLQSASAEDLLGLVEQNQTTVGQLLGKEAEAEALMSDFDTRIEAARADLAEAGLDGTPMVFTYPYAEANSVTIRMHGPGSSPAVIGEAIGLTTAWTEEGDTEYGLTTSDVEGLTNLPEDTQFLYWGNEDTEDPVTTVLADNAVWQQLPFVTEDRVHESGVGIWIYGGTPSLAQLAEDMVAQVTS